MKKLKTFSVQLMTGANAMTILLLLLTGYSDRIPPVDHPLLSTIGLFFPFFLVANLLFLFFWLLFKWTRAWVPVLGFVLACVPIRIYMPLYVFHGEPDSDAIKLITYNVCSYGGNYKYENGLETVLDYLHLENPDIVCIQEDVDARGRALKKFFSKYFAYNDTVLLCNSVLSLNGLGIHTRYPIVRRERICYDSMANGSVAWWLKVGSDTVIVVNNHFESCHLTQSDRNQYRQLVQGQLPADSARSGSKMLLIKLAEANVIRAKQVERVRQYVRAHSRYPAIVCGDFNDHPLSYARHVMAQELTDCYVATGNGMGLSYNQKAFNLRIDHVFCSSDFEPCQCKVDSKMDASDHYPVLCWLKMGLKP